MCLEASEAAADGVIMPALLHAVEDISLKKILPGMRPKWFQDTRHKHEYQPEVIAGMENVEGVCGRPIYTSDDKVGALKVYSRRFKNNNYAWHKGTRVAPSFAPCTWPHSSAQ